MNNKRLTPFLDSSTTHSTVSRLMVVTVCRGDNHPSRFLSPAYSILHSYVHKFKNHTCQRSYHFFLFISSEIIMYIYINLMQLLFLMLYMCCFFNNCNHITTERYKYTYPTCHYLHQSIKQTTYCIQVFPLVQCILKKELQMRQCTFNTKIF